MYIHTHKHTHKHTHTHTDTHTHTQTHTHAHRHTYTCTDAFLFPLHRMKSPPVVTVVTPSNGLPAQASIDSTGALMYKVFLHIHWQSYHINSLVGVWCVCVHCSSQRREKRRVLTYCARPGLCHVAGSSEGQTLDAELMKWLKTYDVSAEEQLKVREVDYTF